MSMTVDDFRENVPVYSKSYVKELKKRLNRVKDFFEKSQKIKTTYSVKDGYLCIEIHGVDHGEQVSVLEKPEENKLEMIYEPKDMIEDKNNEKSDNVKDMTRKELAQLIDSHVPFYSLSVIEEIREKIDKYAGINYEKSIIFNNVGLMYCLIYPDKYSFRFLIPAEGENYNYELHSNTISFKVKLKELKNDINDFPPITSNSKIVIKYYGKNDNRKDIYYSHILHTIKELFQNTEFDVLLSPTYDKKKIKIESLSIPEDKIINQLKKLGQKKINIVSDYLIKYLENYEVIDVG